MALTLPDMLKEDELEHAYDRLAAYARVLKSIELVVKYSAYSWSEDVLELLHSKLQYEGVSIDDVSIDSHVGRFRIVHQGTEIAR